MSQFDIQFCPQSTGRDQDEESFTFEHEGRRQRLRIHDYADIYRIPGLYEALVYDKLQCRSPRRLANLLTSVLSDWPEDLSDLRVLDLGAGNGIMAEELRRIGAGHIVGLDLLPEAGLAAKRDRPHVYDDYVVADLTSLSREARASLQDARLNCLVTVAALGFGDIPPDAFASAFNLVAPGGWLGMTIKEDFLQPSDDESGFAGMLRGLIENGIVAVQAHLRYCHRLSIDGDQIIYVAIAARKVADFPTRGGYQLRPEGIRNGVAGESPAVVPATLLTTVRENSECSP